jgi:hypothetical protein
MAHQMHLNKSGSGMASLTAWADFRLLPEDQKCAKCAASKQAELNKRADARRT